MKKQLATVSSSVQVSSERKGVDILSLPPSEMIEHARRLADALSNIIIEQKLYTKIGQTKFVRYEGWATLGALLGIMPQEKEVKEVSDRCYEATVELYNVKTGQMVGRATHICGKDETTWASRPRYAIRSMAVTRATGKAYRLNFSWIMTLAGYSGTPYEEVENLTTAKAIPVSSKKTEKPVVFDAGKPEDREALGKVLKERNISEDRWEPIFQAMNGKARTDVSSLVRQMS